MRKYAQIIAAVLFISATGVVQAQQWLESIPQERFDRGEAGFFDIQKAFNDYWEPLNVKRGYYEVDGQTLKAPGWKQFKRWEWFWESRVDPETGAFPSTSAYYELQKLREEHPSFKSGTSSGNWTSMGPSDSEGGYSGLGRLNCVAFHPNDNNIIYAGSASGGIWKSSDGGNSWITLSDNNASLGVSDIIILDNGSSETIYIGTGDRDARDNYSVGVLKSIDGGLTWNTTGLNWSQNYYRLINRLLIDPNNQEVLYAATNIGFFKTTNGGNSWTMTNSTYFIDIEFKPGDASTIYASTSTGGNIYRSEDSGMTWAQVFSSGGKRAELAVSPDNPEYVYSIICNSSDALLGIYKSVNGGNSFSQVHGSSPNMLDWSCNGSGTRGQGWYDLCIAADPNDANTVFIGGINTWKSTDGGASWNIKNVWSGNCSGAATEVHADKHFFAYQNGSSILFECNDGGLYKTTDGGNVWIDLSNGLEISQFYRLGVAQTSPDYVIGGLQDNGTKSFSGGNWRDVMGGDGMDCAIDPTNHNIQYGELYYGEIRRTTNNWLSSYLISSGISGSAAWVTPFVLDPSDPSIIYVGYQDVWKRDLDVTSTWTKISNWNASTLRSLAVAPSNSQVICAATQSELYRTTNGGNSWLEIPRPANATITYVSIDHSDPDHFWISFGQYNSYGVFETTDGGITWNDISNGLPSIPVNCVINNKQNEQQQELYAATDLGVFIRLGNADWVRFSDGLPNVVVTELEIYYASEPANSKIRAATYGRGLWESDLYAGNPLHPVTFTENPVLVADGNEDIPYSGSIVSFVDYSGTETLVYTKETGPAWLVVDPADGSLSGTPLNVDVGLNKFTVKASAGSDGSAQAELQINVINSNDAPEFNTDPITGQDAIEASEYVWSIAQFAGDVDGDMLIFSKISGPEWLIVASEGSLSGTPGLADRGANQWMVRVSDGNGAEDSAVLDIFVLPVNHPPVFASDPIIKVEANEDSPYSASLAGDASDPDSDMLTFSKISGPGWLTVAPAGSLSGTPSQSDIGLNNFTVRVDDGKGGTNDASLFIEVINVNDAPVFTSSNISLPDAPSEAHYSGTLAGFATDEDGDQISYSITGPAWLSSDNNGMLSGTPMPADEGINSWSVLADDGKGGTALATLQINVTGIVTYCDPGIWSNVNLWINSVVFNGASLSTGKDIGGYGVYTDTKFQIDANSIVNFSLSPGYSGRSSFAYWNIWIDYNKDGFFDTPGELIYSSTKRKGDFSDVFTVTGAILTSRMRISVSETAGAGACNESKAGEVEDFTIEIVAAGPKPPKAEFSADQTSVSPGTAISFTDLSTDGPTSWYWIFGNGQTSTQQSPSINYSSVGTYSVSLEVSNDYGTGMITKEGYIVVSENTGGDYCEPVNIDNSADYINSVSINGTAGATGQGQYGYYHYLFPVFELAAGSSNNVSMEPFNSKNRNFWRMWIDFNLDGDFDDFDETVYLANNIKGTTTGSINIPTGYSGHFRMRVSMRTGSSPAACDGNFSGEVEDYDVQISAGPVIGGIDPGLEMETSGLMLNIFPNPVNNILNIEIRGFSNEAGLKIFNILGTEIIRKNNVSDNMELDVRFLEKGIYFLVLDDLSQRIVKKIVKD